MVFWANELIGISKKIIGKMNLIFDILGKEN